MGPRAFLGKRAATGSASSSSLGGCRLVSVAKRHFANSSAATPSFACVRRAPLASGIPPTLDGLAAAALASAAPCGRPNSRGCSGQPEPSPHTTTRCKSLRLSCPAPQRIEQDTPQQASRRVPHDRDPSCRVADGGAGLGYPDPIQVHDARLDPRLELRQRFPLAHAHEERVSKVCHLPHVALDQNASSSGDRLVH